MSTSGLNGRTVVASTAREAVRRKAKRTAPISTAFTLERRSRYTRLTFRQNKHRLPTPSRLFALDSDESRCTGLTDADCVGTAETELSALLP
jgi:hypothetical protein